MVNMFNEYKDAGKISDALLIGKNMVNKNPENYEMFQAYLNFLLFLAEKLPSLEERKSFAGQANVTLAFFEENADLKPEIINSIDEYKEKVETIIKLINESESDKSKLIMQEIQNNNQKQIKELYALKQKLGAVKNQIYFDDILQKISAVDSKIEHDYLTAEQEIHYNKINKELSDCISDKMRELEHISNVSYNKEAVEAYDRAFKKFKNDENKYKNQTQLFSLVSTTLFAYDAFRLFNETLIFYNHIYSYIFSKLSDDGKLALTRYSIECERKAR